MEPVNGSEGESSWASAKSQANARAVGEAFVSAFYKLASTNPKDLHKFYVRLLSLPPPARMRGIRALTPTEHV